MKKNIITGIQILGALVAVGFLFVNLSALYTISPLYAKVAENDDDALIVLFKKSQMSKEFREIFPEIQQVFVSSENKVYAEERARKGKIAYLESLLVYNPNARDVLLNLALLYEKDGNSAKASEYRLKAEQIDPKAGK